MRPILDHDGPNRPGVRSERCAGEILASMEKAEGNAGRGRPPILSLGGNTVLPPKNKIGKTTVVRPKDAPTLSDQGVSLRRDHPDAVAAELPAPRHAAKTPAAP